MYKNVFVCRRPQQPIGAKWTDRQTDKPHPPNDMANFKTKIVSRTFRSIPWDEMDKLYFRFLKFPTMYRE